MANLLDLFVFDFQFLEGHFTLPDLGRNFFLEFKYVIAFQPKGHATQDTGVAGISILEGCGHNSQVGQLIHTEDQHKFLRSNLFGNLLDSLLIRKTCGTGGRSDEAGGRFVNNLGTRRFDTLPDRQTTHIVTFAEDGHLFSW
jgi:hypothetical protein